MDITSPFAVEEVKSLESKPAEHPTGIVKTAADEAMLAKVAEEMKSEKMPFEKAIEAAADTATKEVVSEAEMPFEKAPEKVPFEKAPESSETKDQQLTGWLAALHVAFQKASHCGAMGRDVKVRESYSGDAAYLTRLSRAVSLDDKRAVAWKKEVLSHLNQLAVLFLQDEQRLTKVG